MTHTISVIIPTYNSEKWIRPTIDSVLRQTYPDFELIVIDDGSSDDTVEVVNGMADPRIGVYQYPKAEVNGPAAGRNRGLAHALGEFIAFMDHDDMWQPEKLAAQLSALQMNPQAALAYSWVDAIDEDGHNKGPVSQKVVNGHAFDELLEGCFLWTGSNPLIRSSVFQDVGYFSEDVGLADDWDMWLRMAESYPFVCIPQPHVLWRTTQHNTSADATSLAASSLAVLDRTFARNPQLSNEQRNEALTALYEGVIGHSVRSNPTRANSRVTIEAIAAAIRARPQFLYDVWRKPWLLRATVKAATVLVMGERTGQALFETTRKATLR